MTTTKTTTGKNRFTGGWTEEANKILLEGLNQGKSARLIAFDLCAAGIIKTRNAVLGKTHRDHQETVRQPEAVNNRALRAVDARTRARAGPRRHRAKTYHGASAPNLELPKFVELPPTITNCNLFDLPDSGCKYPVRGEGIGTFYCGAPSINKRYCEYHTHQTKRVAKIYTPKQLSQFIRKFRLR